MGEIFAKDDGRFRGFGGRENEDIPERKMKLPLQLERLQNNRSADHDQRQVTAP